LTDKFFSKYKINLTFIDICFFILVSLLPASFIAGALVLEINIIFIFFLSFFFFRNKKNFILKKNFIFLFLLINLYLIIISFFSENIFLSLKTSLPYFRHALFFLIIFNFLNLTGLKFIKFFSLTFLIIYNFLILDAFKEIYFGYNFFGYFTDHPFRHSGLFGDELILGSFLQKFYTIFFISFYICFNKVKNFYVYLCINILIIFFVIQGTGERSAFYLFILNNLLLIFLIKRKFIIILISTILILAFTTYSNLEKNKTFERYFANPIIATINGNIISAEYNELFRVSFNMFLDKKIIGYGPKQFRIICKKEKYYKNKNSCSTHPHNYYIQTLIETGIIGFLILLSIFIINLKKYLQNVFLYKKHKSEFHLISFVIYSGLVVLIFPFASTGNIFNNWLSYLIYFIFAYSYGIINFYKFYNNEKKNF
jgi:O-antigen ligase